MDITLITGVHNFPADVAVRANPSVWNVNTSRRFCIADVRSRNDFSNDRRATGCVHHCLQYNGQATQHHSQILPFPVPNGQLNVGKAAFLLPALLSDVSTQMPGAILQAVTMCLMGCVGPVAARRGWTCRPLPMMTRLSFGRTDPFTHPHSDTSFSHT